MCVRGRGGYKSICKMREAKNFGQIRLLKLTGGTALSQIQLDALTLDS